MGRRMHYSKFAATHVFRDALYYCCDEFVAPVIAAQGPCGRRCVDAMKTPHLVVIDDDPMLLQLLCDFLQDEGYTVTCFTDGLAAYQQLGTLQPDAIILDLRLAQPTSGWFTHELLKRDPALQTIPVIISSADTVQVQQHAADIAKHGDKTVVKPFDLDDLLELLQHLIGPPLAVDA